MLDDRSATEIQSNEVEIHLPESLLLDVVQLAIAKGMTVEQLINKAVADYLQKKRID